MSKTVIEVCVDSVESAIAAYKGGATRLELCGNLVIGGTTPSPELYNEVRRYTDIPMRVLIRPRFGDFCYSEYEFNIMKNEIQMFREMNAEGIVIGMLLPNGNLDVKRLKEVRKLAGNMKVTLHRAFDMCVDREKALAEALSLGIDTILTSGGENTCVEGVYNIKRIVDKANDKIEILVGGGVTNKNVDILKKISQKQRHSTYQVKRE